MAKSVHSNPTVQYISPSNNDYFQHSVACFKYPAFDACRTHPKLRFSEQINQCFVFASGNFSLKFSCINFKQFKWLSVISSTINFLSLSSWIQRKIPKKNRPSNLHINCALIRFLCSLSYNYSYLYRDKYTPVHWCWRWRRHVADGQILSSFDVAFCCTFYYGSDSKKVFKASHYSNERNENPIRGIRRQISEKAIQRIPWTLLPAISFSLHIYASTLFTC